jgi:copper chaperone CopZ
VTILVVEGMGCGRCVAWVRRALLRPTNVLAVEVDLKRGLATVYSRGSVDSRLIAEAASPLSVFGHRS